MRWLAGKLNVLRLSVEQNNSLFDGLPADRTALDLITAILADSVTAQERHVLDAIEAYRTHRQLLHVLQLLLELLHVVKVHVVVLLGLCCRCSRCSGRVVRRIIRVVRRVQVGIDHQIVVVQSASAAQIVVGRLSRGRRRRSRRHAELIVHVNIIVVHIDVVSVVIGALQYLRILLVIFHAVHDFRDSSIRSAADLERNHLLDGRSALHALLHDWRTMIARHQVTARLEKHGSFTVRADEAFVDLLMKRKFKPRKTLELS